MNIDSPSKFWTKMNKSHRKLIKNGGLENFKRTVNMRYFNWDIPRILYHQQTPFFHLLKPINFKNAKNSSFPNPKLDSKNAKNFRLPFATLYRFYVSALYELVAKKDHLKLLDKLEEPELGNPFIVVYKGRKISQDLCNSIHEFYSITDSIDLTEKLRVVEIGAGYGRLAYIFINANKDCTYTIVDIPPALDIAQDYLSRIFPNKKIFKFRNFESFGQIKKEFEKSHIRFLLPHQLKLLPKNSFNVAISISSLHEMTHSQINFYMKEINRLTEGYFYSKQWKKSRARDNSYIKQSEYPIPKNWKVIYNHTHPIQRMFFEALYVLKS